MLRSQALGRYLTAEYEQLRKRREQAMAERQQKAYAQCPAAEAIDREIASLGVRSATKLVGGADADAVLCQMQAELAQLKTQKAQVLASCGLSEADLEVPYQCPKCKDTGYIGNMRCDCYNRRLKQLMLDTANRISGVPMDLESQNFESFQFGYYSKVVDRRLGISPYDNIRSIYKVCKGFCTQFGKRYENLFFYGPAGLGKTFLACSIAKELSEQGFAVLYQTAYKLMNFLEDYKFGKLDREEYAVLRDAVYDCDLLIIDDFGTEFVTGYTQAVFFDVLNTRLAAKRSSIISSNLTIPAIAEIYTERVSSRIVGEFTLLQFAGEDIRRQKQERKTYGSE